MTEGRTTFEELEPSEGEGEEQLLQSDLGFASPRSPASAQRRSPAAVQRRSPAAVQRRSPAAVQRRSPVAAPLRTTVASPTRKSTISRVSGEVPRRVVRRTTPLGRAVVGAVRARSPQAEPEVAPEFITGAQWRKQQGKVSRRKSSAPRPQKTYGPKDAGKVDIMRVAYGRCHQREGGKFEEGEINQKCVWDEVRKILEQIYPEWNDADIEDEIEALQSRKKSGRKETPESKDERRLRLAARALLQPRKEEGGRMKFVKGEIDEQDLRDKMEELRRKGWLEQHRARATPKGTRMNVGGEYVNVSRSASQRARKMLADEIGVKVIDLGKYEQLTAEERERLDELKERITEDLLSGKEKKQPPSRRAGSRKSKTPKKAAGRSGSAQKRPTPPGSPRKQ